MTQNTENLLDEFKRLVCEGEPVPVDVTAQLLEAGIDCSAVEAELTMVNPKGEAKWL